MVELMNGTSNGGDGVVVRSLLTQYGMNIEWQSWFGY